MAAMEGVILPVVKDVERPVTLMLEQCWLDAAMYLLGCVKGDTRYEPASLLSTLECYRRCIEALLEAPWGSVELVRLERWNELAETFLRKLRPNA